MLRYITKLTKEEVDFLNGIINKGVHSTQKSKASFILLNCDEGEHSGHKATDKEISKILKVGMRTIDRVKKRFFGGEEALERRPSTRRYEKKIDDDVEAKLIELCCSEPPAGHAKWSLRLLADRMVELEYLSSISHVSVGKALKITKLSPGK